MARLSGRGRAVRAFVLYAALALAWTARLWVDPAHRAPPNPPDVALFTWLLTWDAHPNPSLHATALNVPDGVNVMWQTALLLPGLVLAPLTRAAGAQVTYDVLLTAGPALSATAAYVVLRRVTGSAAGGLLGGLLYGFSPAVVAETYGGHLHLTLNPLPPVLLLLTGEALAGRRAPARAGVVVGLLAAVQLLVGEELLVATALVGIVVAVLLRPPWARVGRFLVGAVPAGALVAGWPVAAQLFGPQAVRGNVQATGHFQEDLLGFVVPTRLLLVHPGAAVTGRFPTGIQERTAYLGVLLLGLAVALVVARRENRAVRITAVVAGVLAVLSLGADLRVAGVRTSLPLPWALFERVPVVGNLLPARLPLLTALAVALLLAVAVAQWGRRGVVAAVVALVPLIPAPLPVVETPPVPAYFAAQPRGTLLVLPFPTPTDTAAMRWQAAADLSFAMPGGFFVGPDAGGHARFGPVARPSALLFAAVAQTGRVPTITAEVRADFARDVAFWRVRRIVLGPNDRRAALAATVTALVGAPPVVDRGVEVWPLPSSQ